MRGVIGVEFDYTPRLEERVAKVKKTMLIKCPRCKQERRFVKTSSEGDPVAIQKMPIIWSCSECGGEMFEVPRLWYKITKAPNGIFQTEVSSVKLSDDWHKMGGTPNQQINSD